MSKPAIRSESLARDFNGSREVDSRCLEVAEGELFGLPGPNGACESAYVSNLRLKSRRFSRLMSDAGIDPPAPSIRTTSLRGGFRTRIQWKIFPDEDGPRIMGRDPRLGPVPAAEALWLLPEPGRVQAAAVLDVLRSAGRKIPVDGCELRFEHGGPRVHLTLNIKRGRAGGGIFSSLIDQLNRRIPDLAGVSVPSSRLMVGSSRLVHRLPAGEFVSEAEAFFQTNGRLLPKILDEVESRLKPSTPEAVLDLYCGVGLLSLTVARKRTRILGVDISPRAIACARRNAAVRGWPDARFQTARVERFLNEGRDVRADLIILNPSRSGCAPGVIPAAAALRPASVLMMSCNPETGVRDLHLWKQEGFRITSLSAYDMFPFTPFLETVSILSRD